jgi:hypothetical protein
MAHNLLIGQKIINLTKFTSIERIAIITKSLQMEFHQEVTFGA